MALVGAGVSAVELEYQVSVKVSWDFAMSLDSLGCKTYKKAGIQWFYCGTSQNFTGVILDIWGIAAGFLIPALLFRGGQTVSRHQFLEKCRKIPRRISISSTARF